MRSSDTGWGAAGACSPKSQQVLSISAQSVVSAGQQQQDSISVWSLQIACAGSATAVNAKTNASKNLSIEAIIHIPILATSALISENGRGKLISQAKMQDKLSEKEVVRLVEVVSKLDQEQQQMLDKAQVRQILQDLNLSDDLLEQAMVRLEQERVGRKKQKKMIATIAAVAALIVIGVSTSLYMGAVNTATMGKISAGDPQVTITAPNQNDIGGALAQVTLHDVPLGVRLPMRSEWVDPAGQIVHENTWQTKTTDKRTWQTHAKLQLPSNAAQGDWTVKIFLADRLVATKKFVVNRH